MKSNIKYSTICAIFLLTVFFTACISNIEEQQEELNSSEAKVSYVNTVKPILEARCLSCHGTGGNFPELKNYSEVSTYATIVKNEVASGRMPRGAALTAAQIKSIIDWVEEGALDN
jgi:mono/diheme cytochrome c family protein